MCNRPFLRNVLKLLSGRVIAQLIALLCAPILTRLYTPEDFGILGLIAAISSFLALFATFRFDLALVLPRENLNAWKLFCLACMTSLLVSTLLFFLLLLLGEKIEFFNRLNFYEQTFIWIPSFVLSLSLLSLAQHWAIRCKSFGIMSKASIASSLFSNICKISAGLFGFGALGLIFGTFLQQITQTLVLGFRLVKTIPLTEKKSEGYFDLAKRYRSFPLWRMPQDIMSSIAYNLPNFLLVTYYNANIVGFYLLAYRVAQAPTSFIKEGFQKVFYQKATELHNRGECFYYNVRNTTFVLVLICLPFLIFLILFGENLFVRVFGKEWLTAGTYSKYLGILVSGFVANTPSVVALTVLEKNRELLTYELIRTGLQIIAFLFAVYYLNAESAIAIFSVVSAIANFCLVFWVLIYLRKKHGIRKTS